MITKAFNAKENFKHFIPVATHQNRIPNLIHIAINQIVFDKREVDAYKPGNNELFNRKSLIDFFLEQSISKF